jgi:hypothetical protein
MERICSVEPEQTEGREVVDAALDDYLAALGEALEETPDCKLVVIDPLLALVENVDGWLSRAMRQMLRGLARLARKHGVAIVAVADLGLRASLHSLERMLNRLRTGGTGIAALGIFRDPADADQQWLLSLDANFAVEQTAMKLQLVNVESDTPTIEWGEAAKTSLQKLIGSGKFSGVEQEYRDREEYVTEKLQEILADGPVRRSSMEFFVYGSDDRMLRAAKRLRVVKQKVGYNGGWVWMLPEHFPAWQAEQAAKKEQAAAQRRAKKECETREVTGMAAPDGNVSQHGRKFDTPCGERGFDDDGFRIEQPDLPLAAGTNGPDANRFEGISAVERSDKKFARWRKRRNKKLQQQNGELDQTDERVARQGELPAQRSGP